MKKIIGLVVVIIIIIGCGIFSYYEFKKLTSNQEMTDVKWTYSQMYKKYVYVGDVWRWDNPDPFSDYKYLEFEILDIKDNYVKFKCLRENSWFSWEGSSSIDLIVSGGSKLISRKNGGI
jgi:hypothetical protein